MSDEKPISDVTTQTNKAELGILYLLADPNDGPALWTVDEVARELDNPDAIDSINALHRAGLIHRTQTASSSQAAQQRDRRNWPTTSCDGGAQASRSQSHGRGDL
jgi:hypothetical protein